VEDQLGIYRSEVTDMFAALLDIKSGVLQIIRYIEGEDDGEEAEEEDF
jgi:hypothetical protein